MSETDDILRDERIMQPEAYLFNKSSFKRLLCSDTMIETELIIVFFISLLRWVLVGFAFSRPVLCFFSAELQNIKSG